MLRESKEAPYTPKAAPKIEEKPLEIEPCRVAQDWYNLGINAESLEGAVACFKMVTIVDTGHIDAYGKLADTYLELGDKKEAFEYLKKVNELRKKDKLPEGSKVPDEDIIKALLDEAEKLKGRQYDKH